MFEARSITAEHKDLIHDIAYDFYGQRMATCSSDQFVKVWKLFFTKLIKFFNGIFYSWFAFIRFNKSCMHCSACYVGESKRMIKKISEMIDINLQKKSLSKKDVDIENHESFKSFLFYD